MNFHNTAIKYAQLAAATVDSRGHLLHQVGSYPAGTVRDAELAELEQAYRSTVIAEVVSSSELKATAHVVLSQDDEESGADAVFSYWRGNGCRVRSANRHFERSQVHETSTID
jgi:hypothetical protein